MTKQAFNFGTLPAAVEQFLTSAREALNARRIDRLRLYPLILRASLETLITRRKRLFDFVHADPKDYGLEVIFKRHLKWSKNFPDGRDCEGVFHLLSVAEGIIVVASTLVGDHHRYGPTRFTDKAYPLARRPFLPSTTLIRLIERLAANRGWTPTTRDTWGYHRQSRSPRRDLEHQPPADAAREMAEQGRLIHRMKVTFRRQSHEKARLTFDRNAALTMFRGNPSTALRELVLPGIAEATETNATYEVVRTPEPMKQEVVELDFADEPFDTYDAMRRLCDAVRQGDGLNVAIIHLNPYLHAQILDFFTGAAVELLVTDSRSVSLVPRSGDCGSSIQRVATTIFRHFGEGRPKRGQLTEG